MTGCITIFWTCSSIEEARRIGHLLLEKRLVACINMIPNIESLFFWEGKVESSKEVKALLKTTKAFYKAVKEVIEREASYEISEVTFVEWDGGNESYLNWIKELLLES